MGKGIKTMLGREIDMDALLEKNQMMPSVGNVRMNARGDELGPGGQIVKKREDQVAAYYENNPMARPVAKTAAPVSAPVEKAVEKAPEALRERAKEEYVKWPGGVGIPEPVVETKFEKKKGDL
jgi:hypothetical protein